MQDKKTIIYIVEISLMIFLLCCIIYPRTITNIMIAIVLVAFMIISEKLIKSYKSKGKYNKKVTPVMLGAGLIYLAILYVLGIYMGFYRSIVRLSGLTIINFIIPYVLIIISIENIRKTILLKDDKKSKIMLLILTVLIDVVLTTNIYTLRTPKDYYILIGFRIFASIANNLLYNYIIIKHRNCRAIIVYKIITTIYLYVIPITPDIHILFESVIRIVIPYVIYLIVDVLYSKKEKKVSKTSKTKDIVITSILTIFAGGIIMLVSCQFRYGILSIGSGSMTGTINKGDAIIYEKLEEEPEIGDVIVFESGNVKVVHRVIDKKDSGTGMKYITKGDANPNEDEGYRTKTEIIGKVKIRIPYMGQLAVLLSEISE